MINDFIITNIIVIEFLIMLIGILCIYAVLGYFIFFLFTKNIRRSKGAFNIVRTLEERAALIDEVKRLGGSEEEAYRKRGLKK